MAGSAFVAIIGGFLDNREDTEAAKAAAQAIGMELAQAGFGLVVYSSRPDFLESHVVAGYVHALSAGVGAGAIHIRHAQSQPEPVRFLEEDRRPELFQRQLFPGDDWETPFYRSIANDEVDAVLLLAGGASTLIAGQIAVARRLPVLAVHSFGGSAMKIWTQLTMAARERRLSWGEAPARTLVEQLKAECEAAEKRREERRRRDQAYRAIVSKRRKAYWATGAFMVFLVTIYFGMVHSVGASWYLLVLLSGLVAAGATGASVKALIWGPDETDPVTSLLLGSIAGFVVGVAYMLPQWVGAPGLLEGAMDVTADLQTDSVGPVAAGGDTEGSGGAVATTKRAFAGATYKIHFLSSVLVAISAGVGFDAVFNRLQKQAQDVPIGPGS
jgi:hypothetical protein